MAVPVTLSRWLVGFGHCAWCRDYFNRTVVPLRSQQISVFDFWWVPPQCWDLRLRAVFCFWLACAWVPWAISSHLSMAAQPDLRVWLITFSWEERSQSSFLVGCSLTLECVLVETASGAFIECWYQWDFPWCLVIHGHTVLCKSGLFKLLMLMPWLWAWISLVCLPPNPLGLLRLGNLTQGRCCTDWDTWRF